MSVMEQATRPRTNQPQTGRQTRFQPTRRDFLAGAAALGVGLTLDSGMIARHDLEVADRTIRLARLPEAFHGFRIAQISDIHLEEFTEPWFLRLVLRRVNALRPDLVLLTGDFASMGPLPRPSGLRAAERCASMLPELTCPQRFAALGNHDNVLGAAPVIAALESHGTPVLVNRYLPIERNGQRLWLGGLDDPGTGSPRLDLAIPAAQDSRDSPILLMCHAPDYIDTIVQNAYGSRASLVLSGHTHGGQVRLPFLRPLVLPPLGEKYVEGLFLFGLTQLYVNRGIGTTGLPFRLNCPPEITHITLQPA